eukprot:4683219-Prymnesium_polylepis.1
MTGAVRESLRSLLDPRKTLSPLVRSFSKCGAMRERAEAHGAGTRKADEATAAARSAIGSGAPGQKFARRSFM